MLAHTVFTRREFLRSVAIASAGMAMPQFLVRAATAAAGSSANGENVLVVIQLGGGNDGLNTVVPYVDDAYHIGRPRIGLKKERLIPINDEIALNDKLEPLMRLYDNGQLAIVNGVGYPNPNRSHFRSMEIWQTAVDSDRYSNTGWVGRYFDNCCKGKPDPVTGVNVGGEMPQAFASKSGAGVSFQRPEDFRWVSGRTESDAAFRDVNHADKFPANEKDTLDFLRHTTANAVVSSDKVRKAGSNRKPAVEYPQARLSSSLQTIATLIAGGLPTRLYYAATSGFDTHANQQGIQDNLLGQFGGALEAFLKDLKTLGVADRVTVLCFSEFGRRVAENASRGTDHGTAGPVFIAGAGIQPGLYGKYPSLTDLDDGDLKHTVDFRSLYAELLDRRLSIKHEEILGRPFKHEGVISA